MASRSAARHRRRPVRLAGFRQVSDADRAVAGYQGIVFTEQFGPAAFIDAGAHRGTAAFGACLSPTNAFHLLQGVETLGLRMQRHVENTRAVLDFLTGHKAVAWVAAPGPARATPTTRSRNALLPRGAGSIVSFGIKGGRAGRRASFIETLRLASHLANVGDAKTLVIHPASTHASADGRRAARGRGHRRGHGAAVGRHRVGGGHRRAISARPCGPPLKA